MPAHFFPPLALQGIVEVFQNPATAWIIIPILIFSIPLLQALMGPVNNAIKAGEREKLRKMYERLALEKLDIVKTAVAMGYQHSELRELDERLEGVIGSDAMKAMLEGKPAGGKSGAKMQINITKSGTTESKAAAEISAADFEDAAERIAAKTRNRE